ncbi:MAG: hypothetical protein IJ343_01485 [Clostridia bacterium]|nr:hypothetical protein [Clostridia bacterium]
MRWLLGGAMVLLLMRSGTAMNAVRDSCRLFVTSVLPGLLPYMTLSAMLVSRWGAGAPEWLLTLAAWGGGSPTGARLLRFVPGMPHRRRICLAVAGATMSPMFLAGTCGAWLGSPAAGWVLLGSSAAGGAAAGALAQWCTRERPQEDSALLPTVPLSLGEAVEQSSRTLLLVCGTMAVLRVFAELAAEAVGGPLSLPLTTLLEVTAGVRRIAALPLPLAWRTALVAGATGFGGLAGVMQNRTLYPPGFLPLGRQLLWQAVHAAVSFLLALGGMLLWEVVS